MMINFSNEKLSSSTKLIFGSMRMSTNRIDEFGVQSGQGQFKSCQCILKDTLFGAVCGHVAKNDENRKVTFNEARSVR